MRKEGGGEVRRGEVTERQGGSRRRPGYLRGAESCVQVCSEVVSKREDSHFLILVHLGMQVRIGGDDEGLQQVGELLQHLQQRRTTDVCKGGGKRATELHVQR